MTGSIKLWHMCMQCRKKVKWQFYFQITSAQVQEIKGSSFLDIFFQFDGEKDLPSFLSVIMVLFLLHLGRKWIGNYSLGQLQSDSAAKCKGQILCIFQNPILRRSLFPSFSTLLKIYGFSHCFMIITAQDAHCTGPKGIESPKSQHFWNLMWNISQDNGYWYWSQSVCFALYI